MGIGVGVLFCEPDPGARTSDWVLFHPSCAGMGGWGEGGDAQDSDLQLPPNSAALGSTLEPVGCPWFPAFGQYDL